MCLKINFRLRDGDAEQAESLIQIHETDKEVWYYF